MVYASSVGEASVVLAARRRVGFQKTAFRTTVVQDDQRSADLPIAFRYTAQKFGAGPFHPLPVFPQRVIIAKDIIIAKLRHILCDSQAFLHLPAASQTFYW